ncbi:MAG TPA: 2-oxo-4-hydroxy-4-carboxy-5-ureidoimidazoline decarboxylase [Pseudolabrys sp.]|jgi:2-oxo-4-hydroxy-4-carboxy-5-ureidoimidazoline decarboxylase|nr:2-oxo-4-hydroxy-4-carboxy-5-ureidoimidazoline decarboxylase [Pseudolabrys sp.]
MSAGASVSLHELNAFDRQRFVSTLGAIYENSPWVAEAAAADRPYSSLSALHERMSGVVLKADESRKLTLLNAHPDLAGKAARAGTLTAESEAEQKDAGLDRLSEKEFFEFHRLNETYRKKFGFPFIICVRRHSKDSLFRQFDLRTKNDQAVERNAALKEVIRIAALRLNQRVAGVDQLNVNGRLSTHVLDAYSGRPAQGVALELHELSQVGSDHLIVAGVTNIDGRTDGPLISGRPVPIGGYELRFALGDYFRRSGIILPDPPFLDKVPVRFSIADPESHYHVPLLATPWSYSIYRGS